MQKIKLTRNTIVNGEAHAIGWTGEVSDKDAQLLISINKAEAVEAKASAPAVSDKPADAPKPLSKMNRADLDAIVIAEGVDIGDASTNKAIAAKIAEHQAKASAPA